MSKTARDLIWVAVLIAASAVMMLSGCVVMRREPDLEFPQRPAITFGVCRPGFVCLTDADADKLLKWVKEIAAFEAARQRVLKPEDQP
jgi:hypothetical protein